MRSARSAAQGAAAGLVATAVMTTVMDVGRRCGAMERFPPRHVVRAALPAGRSDRPRSGEDALTAGAHLGFGAGAGAVFGLLTGDRRPGARAGIGYGLAVWLCGYQGWVPLLGAEPPAHRDAPARAWTVAAAHAVYGAVLAGALRCLRGRSSR